MNERIRLALVITELEVGGAERCLTQIATGLDRNRFAPVVYALASRPPASRSALVQQLKDAAVPVQFVGVRASWQLGTAIKRLRRLLAEQRPQLVQTFLFHGNVVGTLSVRGLHSSPHAPREESPPRLVHGMRVADPSWLRQAIERRTSARADKVVCVSRSVSAYCAARLRLPADKLVVIPNGIEVEAYTDLQPANLADFGLPPGRRAIVFVGRLHRQKGLDWLLSFAPRLLEQLPDHDLLLVGDGPERARLEARVQALGLERRIHLAGWSPQVPQILRAAEMLILPSRWEGMPNVLLEAMAAALPIVTTQAEGVQELLGPLADEQSVAFWDQEAFLDRLRRLAENRQLAAGLGRQNRERVERHFSRQAMLHAYEELYASLATP
jgi:glycosyltransferase involved in cell wall biosynthesis